MKNNLLIGVDQQLFVLSHLDMQPRKSCSAAGSSACWLLCFPFPAAFAAFLSPCNRPPRRMQRQHFQQRLIDFATCELSSNYSIAQGTLQSNLYILQLWPAARCTTLYSIFVYSHLIKTSGEVKGANSPLDTKLMSFVVHPFISWFLIFTGLKWNKCTKRLFWNLIKMYIVSPCNALSLNSWLCHVFVLSIICNVVIWLIFFLPTTVWLMLVSILCLIYL